MRAVLASVLSVVLVLPGLVRAQDLPCYRAPDFVPEIVPVPKPGPGEYSYSASDITVLLGMECRIRAYEGLTRAQQLEIEHLKRVVQNRAQMAEILASERDAIRKVLEETRQEQVAAPGFPVWTAVTAAGFGVLSVVLGTLLITK